MDDEDQQKQKGFSLRLYLLEHHVGAAKGKDDWDM